MVLAKISTQRILLTCAATIGLLYLLSCKKDETKPNILVPAKYVSSNCAFFMQFEMETTTLSRPIRQEDVALLEQIDLVAGLPHRERYEVEVCYQTNGQKEFSMVRQEPNAPITYPEYTADGYLKPDYHRLLVSYDGSIAYYDKNEKIFRVSGFSPDAQNMQKMADLIANNTVMTEEEFCRGLEIMKDSGLVVTELDNGLVSILCNGAGGEFSVQIVDKATQVAVAHQHYDQNGKLTGRSFLDVEGTPQSPVIKKLYTENIYTSISGNIPMKMEQFSYFDNFSLVKN